MSGAAGKADLTFLDWSLGTVPFFLPLVLSFRLLICLQSLMFLQRQGRIIDGGQASPAP